MEQKSDIELLEAIKADDYTAFDVIYERYWESMFSFSFKLTKDKESAVQFTQDIFVQLWESRHRKQIQNLKAYMFQSLKYRYFQNYKSGSTSLISLSEEFEDYLVDVMQVFQSDQSKQLIEALEELPKKRKEILLMNIYQDMKPEEIAVALGLSTQTVRNQLSSAIKQLRVYFKNRPLELSILTLLLTL